MNKRDFAKIYMEINKNSISMKETMEEIEVFLETVEEALIRDGKVRFVGRGIFEVIERKPRIISNPSTRELMKIYPKKTVKFRVAKNIYNEVNKI
ncbi:HU family DNA-binding protein [Fusobacterium sp. THCT13E1]|uniref:HU family DNA-binding protein n=1 Tax=Fusobacterium ulcerans TaxID=861 RepID=UPI001031C5C1|nr:HU family DNA-binding protein [Fusobacterium ulcerans]